MSKNIKVKKKILIESSVVFLIALTPFLFKLYDYLPKEEGSNLSFLGISIDSNGFDSVSTYAWFMMGKLIPLVLLIIWFFTSKDWWYHILIIPIATYAFQVFELLFSEDDVVDTENIWWIIPICMIIIPFVYFIRIKLYDKYVHGIDLEAMEAELEELKEKNISDGYTSKASLDIQIQDELKPESLSEEIDRKLSTNNLEQGLKIFQEKLENWFHFKF